LQLSAEGNIQVVYPTTPAQFCHALRRQMLRSYRKPLIVMTPKSPLRMPEVVSPLESFTNGSFENLLVTTSDPKKTKRVILCTGKVYWDLLKFANEKGLKDETTFVRVEQLYPLDLPELAELKKRFAGASHWIRVQE